MATGTVGCTSDGYEWVEMIEPESQQTVYANPITGVILFEPPEGVSIKPMSDNQWWELLDSSCNTCYYHNPHTKVTVWEKPVAADIISLTRLQETIPTEGQEDVDGNSLQQQTTVGPTDTSVVPSEDQVAAPSHPQDSTSASYQWPSKNETRPSTKVGSRKSKPEPLQKPIRKTSDLFAKPLDTLSPLNVEYNGHRFSAFEADIAVVESRGSTLSSVGSASSSNTAGAAFVNSTSTTSSGGRRLGISDRSDFSTHIAAQGAFTSSTLPKSRGSTYGGRHSAGGLLEGTGYHSLGRHVEGKNLSDKGHASSAHQRGPPTPPALPSMPRSVSLMAEPLERFGDLAQHKRGFFRKKVTIANMLCWTKEPIKQPMILTRDKTLRKEAIDMFKLVLQFMGDRRSKIKDPDAIALQITSRAWQRKGLADEVYIQLCRQTTGNSKPESLRRGWELLTICLAFFPPTVRFRSYLEGYLWKHVDPSSANRGVPVETYATYCHKRVEKMTQWGPKKGLKKPTIEEIKHAKNQPFQPSFFGTTLEEAMEIQADAHPDYDIPWIIVELSKTVLRLQGPYTEGIFRVPGDIDEVNALKLHMDKGQAPPENLQDPHIPASLLKLWFRELEDPLIPENFYQSCVDNCNNLGNVLSLVDSLPDLNKKVLFYLVDFLQSFIGDDNIKITRMSVENIAMVWAPNFLRCPSDDHVLIFENTRKEMSFMRLLITHLNVDS